MDPRLHVQIGALPTRRALFLLLGLLLLAGWAAAVAPTASFTASPDSGTYPLSVQFTDTSSGSPTMWMWDFGDGWTSTVQNPQHTYTATVSATYTVVLEVTNGDGSSQTTDTIYTYAPAGPSASFYATPTSGTAPLTVQFFDTSTGSPTSWLWETGDGYSLTGKYPSHTYTASGTYTVILTAYNAYGSDTETKAAYITVGSGVVASSTISGTVYDPSGPSPLDGATVTISNTTGWSSTTTSTGGGYYKFESLIPGAYSVQGAKTGYTTSTTYAIQAYADTVSTQDIPLTASGVAVTGTCYDAVTGTALEGATVTATQGSATVTNTTGAAGTYAMDSFTTSTSISLSAALTGYTHTAITLSPTASGSFTRNLYLIPTSISYTGQGIGGLVTSTRDDQAVQGATVTGTPSSGGTTATALTNPTGFYLLDNLTVGQWGVSAAATGYAASQTYTHTLENGTLASQNLGLAPSSQNRSITYTPNQVRFTYISATGVPLAGLNVSATGISTSAGSWDWFLSLFGLDVSETNLATTAMSGVTGSDGSITFMMLESVYYAINASSTDLGVALTTNLYPKESEYVITVWTDLPSAADRVTWALTASEENTTHTNLEVSYLDRGERTLAFTFSVYDENRTLLYSDSYEDDAEIEISYPVENLPGEVLIWGFNATLNSTAGTPEYLQADQYIRFDGAGAWDFGLPETIRHWLGFLFLLCIGAMFGYISLKFAGPIVGLFALILKFMDYLPIGWELAITIFVLGCLSYVRFAKDERMV